MRKLKRILKKHSGRGQSGQIVVRHQGGRQKRYLRVVDFKRDKKDMGARVVAIEYDPNRTAEIALLLYEDGEKRYILCPDGLKVGDVVMSASEAEVKVGNSLPLRNIPVGTIVHNVETIPLHGGRFVRGAGEGAAVVAKEDSFVQIKMPSAEVRRIPLDCYATIGRIGKEEWKTQKLGKAGRSRRMGIRPTVRGVAQNPRSHPHGGGEGRSGIGMPAPKTYTGRLAVGKTRKKGKYSDRYIITRRKHG